MTTQLTTTKRICEHLEKYVFDRVWNEPYTQYRTYVKPELLSKNVVLNADGTVKKINDRIVYRPYFAAGFFPSRYGSVLLPPYVSDAELLEWLPKLGPQFAVYSVPASIFGSTVLNIPEWTLFSTYCTKNHLDLQMFTKSGTCLNRGYIYIKQSDQNDSMLIAVESTMYRKIIGDIGRSDDSGWYPHSDDMLFGQYFDSDEEADNLVGFCKLTASQVPLYKSMENIGRIELPAGNSNSVKLSEATYVIKNGHLCVGDYSTEVAPKDYLEAVVDEDIRGYFDVAIDPNLIYTDNETEDPEKEGTGTQRLLIHIPRRLNKNYNLITPDTCGIWAIPNKTNSTSGILLYACGREDQFHQVTHNDFSINVEFLKQLAEENGWVTKNNDGAIVSWDILVRVYVRTHGKQTVFIRDGHYIDYLYNLDDEGIIQMLMGTHPWQLEHNELLFWKADYLEDSKYTDALLRRRSRELDTFAVDADDFSYEDKQWCKQDIYNKDLPPKGQCSVCGIQNLCPYKKTEPIKDRVCPYYSSRSIQDYIEILGYFHVLALIGKRIFHFKMTASGTQYVVVMAPLALSYPELEPEDYYPIVYLNGERVEQTDVSWHETAATNVDAKEMIHSDGSDLTVADIIPSNYSTRLKVSINKVYRETKSITFANDVRYYKKYNGQYVRALVVEATPVEVVKKGYDAEGQMIRINQGFKAGITYYSRINKEYRKLVCGVDYEVGDDMYAFTQANQGYLIFTGLERLDPNELAVVDGVVGDYVRLDDDEVIYELHNEVKKGDIISVELLDRRSGGVFETIDTSQYDPNVDLTHQFATLDSWAIYQVTEVNDIDGTKKNRYTQMDPATVGFFDETTYLFTFHQETVMHGDTFLLVEGPNALEDKKLFQIQRGYYHDDANPYHPGTAGIIGEDMWKYTDGSTVKTSQLAAPLDSELVFLNGKRLIPDLDYVTHGHDNLSLGGREMDTLSVYGQCISYLEENNDLTVIRTNTTVIPDSVQRGFVIGHHISWKGQTPIWFDELSTLTVDGKLVADYRQILGEMTLSPIKCRNGATYEIKTSVSTLVKDILSYDDAMNEDLKRIREIHTFFIESFELPDMTAIIPHSHRLYSIFLEAIITKYLTDDSFSIKRLNVPVAQGGCGGDLTVYKNQFLNNPYFAYLKDIDVIYDETRIEPFYLNYIDVYGIYHPLIAKYREDYDTLHELCDVFLPEDNIKHKEAKK